MSGHNKFSKIKNKKAANDAATGKIKTVIAKARANNMPNDNINRSIKKATGELSSVNYEAMTYEGYGPAGSAVIVQALTDNKNRTASEVRHYFDHHGGSLGSTNCVSYLFTKKGVLIFLKVLVLQKTIWWCILSKQMQKIA